MSPPSKITRQDVVNAAYKIVRKHGWSKFSARAIAKELKSSTMPIYSHFDSMKELEFEVVGKIMALLGEYESGPHTGIQALDHGIGYVLFAWEEPNLFAAINDRKHVGMQVQFGNRQFDRHVEELTRNPRMQGYSKEQLVRFQFLAWIFANGLASIKNWVDGTRKDGFTKQDLIDLIREGSRTLTYGFIQLHSRNAPGREDIRQDSPDDRKKGGEKKETKKIRNSVRVQI